MMCSRSAVRGLTVMVALMAAAGLSACDDDDSGASSDAQVGTGGTGGSGAGGTGDAQDSGTTEDGETWTDPGTSLTWQVLPTMTAFDAHDTAAYCDALALDGDGWRVPTLSELRSIIRGCEGTETGGACPVNDECTSTQACLIGQDACLGCALNEGPGTGWVESEKCYWPDELEGKCGHYWSATPEDDHDDHWFFVNFPTASFAATISFQVEFLRCVR